jgi:uncharacterized membrane protein
MRAAGLVLLVLGVLILSFGAFSYTREKGDVKIGPIEIQVTEREQVEIPLWAGVGAVAVGGLLLMRRSVSSH